jgi:pyruvate/2-oxoacid:ferredoxin oxidoreductase beta subunit
LIAFPKSLQRYSPKPLCDGCTNCGVIKLCIACPESKAAAAKDARLVCGPKMSEPAWYVGGRPEAAASVNNLLDIRDNAVA